MRHGFVQVAAATPKVKVADVAANVESIIACAKHACQTGAKLIVFPELAVTGISCEDLFFQDALIYAAADGLKQIAEQTQDLDALLFIGLPLLAGGRLYNTVAVVNCGRVIGFVPKSGVTRDGSCRYFTPGDEAPGSVKWSFEEVPFGTDLLFACDTMEQFLVAAEIGDDLFAPVPVSTFHALAGAVLIAGSGGEAASMEDEERPVRMVLAHSDRTCSAYVLACAGPGESTTDRVYSGRNIICENGTLLAAAPQLSQEIQSAQIDLELLHMERRRSPDFTGAAREAYRKVPFHLELTKTRLDGRFSRQPFLSEDPVRARSACETAVRIQAAGLAGRMKHIGCTHPVIGISGGLDSTLALLVTVRAMDEMGLPKEQIEAVTMPCFGTTDRTYRNALRMIGQLGCHLREIRIADAVTGHFSDIGHDPDVHNAAYENAQARERTQILMDIANDLNGLVVGTGDFSELALGWATYNGDHMSNYCVNGSIPKTLVRKLVEHIAETCEDPELSEILTDVIDTPVSPELLPPDRAGRIAQKTEDLVGPYELHDFVLYHMLRYGFGPAKILRMAEAAFDGIYDRKTIVHWMQILYRRFFSQQFKRSCLPDGVQVGRLSLSPRGGYMMPSDASSAVWLAELEAM